MSEIAGILDSLEARVAQLIARNEGLEKQVNELRLELEKSAAINTGLTGEIKSLKAEYDSLKIANSLLGSEENKRDAKLRINSLIREIDYCIAQLAD